MLVLKDGCSHWSKFKVLHTLFLKLLGQHIIFCLSNAYTYTKAFFILGPTVYLFLCVVISPSLQKLIYLELNTAGNERVTKGQV